MKDLILAGTVAAVFIAGLAITAFSSNPHASAAPKPRIKLIETQASDGAILIVRLERDGSNAPHHVYYVIHDGETQARRVSFGQ